MASLDKLVSALLRRIDLLLVTLKAGEGFSVGAAPEKVERDDGYKGEDDCDSRNGAWSSARLCVSRGVARDEGRRRLTWRSSPVANGFLLARTYSTSSEVERLIVGARVEVAGAGDGFVRRHPDLEPSIQLEREDEGNLEGGEEGEGRGREEERGPSQGGAKRGTKDGEKDGRRAKWVTILRRTHSRPAVCRHVLKEEENEEKEEETCLLSEHERRTTTEKDCAKLTEYE